MAKIHVCGTKIMVSKTALCQCYLCMEGRQWLVPGSRKEAWIKNGFSSYLCLYHLINTYWVHLPGSWEYKDKTWALPSRNIWCSQEDKSLKCHALGFMKETQTETMTSALDQGKLYRFSACGDVWAESRKVSGGNRTCEGTIRKTKRCLGSSSN